MEVRNFQAAAVVEGGMQAPYGASEEACHGGGMLGVRVGGWVGVWQDTPSLLGTSKGAAGGRGGGWSAVVAGVG